MSEENTDIIYRDGWNGFKRTEVIYYNVFFTFGCIPLVLAFYKEGIEFWPKLLYSIISLSLFCRGFFALIIYLLSIGKFFEIRNDYLSIPGVIGINGFPDGKIFYPDIKKVVDYDNIVEIEKTDGKTFCLNDVYFNDWNRFKKLLNFILNKKDTPIIKKTLNME